MEEPQVNSERLRRFLHRVNLVVGAGKEFGFKIKLCTLHASEFKNDRTELIKELNNLNNVVALNIFDKYRGNDNLDELANF